MRMFLVLGPRMKEEVCSSPSPRRMFAVQIGQGQHRYASLRRMVAGFYALTRRLLAPLAVDIDRMKRDAVKPLKRVDPMACVK